MRQRSKPIYETRQSGEPDVSGATPRVASSFSTPFLKWAGGKRQLLDQLIPAVPKFESYFEPFLGGGALFFALSDNNSRFDAVLGDTNIRLIETYRTVRDDVESLIDILQDFEEQYLKKPKTFYYMLRDNFKLNSSLAQAARFIALNRTCYNGLYRVNSKGQFNVPMGNYKQPRICNKEILRRASKRLNDSNALLVASDYETIISHARRNDFVYLDPPFSPESNTSNFVSYTETGFDINEQERLSRIFRHLDKRGCKVMLSNSDTKVVRDLYAEFSASTTAVNVLRSINSDASARANHRELLICNYNLLPGFQHME